MKARGAAWRLAISIGVSAVLLVLVINAVSNPLAAQTHSYTARFTDASGLHAGADVRVRGVRVGKVDSTALERHDGQSVAAVGFTLDSHYGIVPTSRIAVKFQALTGLRYLDVLNPSEGYSSTTAVPNVPVAMTLPSFDITSLFNGLQPVLATLSPDEINTFTDNAVTLLSGDGQGLGPLLDSIRKLTEFVTDRQQIVATLMHNLAALADTMGGHSQDLIKIVQWLNRPIDGALVAIDEFRKSQIYGPAFTDAAVRLLHNAGMKPGVNIDDALDRAFNNVDDAVQAFKLLPVMWENIPDPQSDGVVAEPCSRGHAQLPASLDVLLNGQKVALCNR